MKFLKYIDTVYKSKNNFYLERPILTNVRNDQYAGIEILFNKKLMKLIELDDTN